MAALDGVGEPRASDDKPPFAEVIVPTEQRRTFEQLVDAVHKGRAPAFVEDGEPENPFGIQPIEIEPLTITDLRAGIPAEGEERP